MTTPASTPAGTRTGKSGLPILRPGQLLKQVHDTLAGDPAKSWTVGEMARRLGGRSHGAVGQAFDRLTDLGKARVSAGKPRRWRAATGATTPTPVTPPPLPRRPRPGPVTRPNGQAYYPRLLGGRPDVDVLRDLRAAEIPVLLYGPPGTGKTSLIEAAFGDELHTVAGDGDTTVGDLLGDYVPTADGRYEFVDGPLVRAMEGGGVLLIDDATLISPKVLAVVYPAMDGRRQVVVKANGGKVIAAKPGFYVVAGHNPGVHGAVLTEALASRFTTQVRVSTDYDLAAQLGVDRAVVRAARVLNAKVDAGEIGWAPQLRELLGFHKVAAALGRDAAIANLVGVAPPEDRDLVVDVFKNTVPGAEVTPLSLGRQIPPRR